MFRSRSATISGVVVVIMSQVFMGCGSKSRPSHFNPPGPVAGNQNLQIQIVPTQDIATGNVTLVATKVGGTELPVQADWRITFNNRDGTTTPFPTGVKTLTILLGYLLTGLDNVASIHAEADVTGSGGALVTAVVDVTVVRTAVINMPYEVRVHPTLAPLLQLVLTRENLAANDSQQIFISARALDGPSGNTVTQLFTLKEISTTVPVSSLGAFDANVAPVIEVTFHAGPAFLQDVIVEFSSGIGTGSKAPNTQ